jgi:hypothetical protein
MRTMSTLKRNWRNRPRWRHFFSRGAFVGLLVTAVGMMAGLNGWALLGAVVILILYWLDQARNNVKQEQRDEQVQRDRRIAAAVNSEILLHLAELSAFARRYAADRPANDPEAKELLQTVAATHNALASLGDIFTFSGAQPAKLTVTRADGTVEHGSDEL